MGNDDLKRSAREGDSSDEDEAPAADGDDGPMPLEEEDEDGDDGPTIDRDSCKSSERISKL